MKKFTTLVLVLVLTLSTLLSVVPFGAFAEETAVTFTDNTGYTTGGNGGSIFRKKSDGSIMLSPFNTPLREMITAGADYSEFTIEMTFTLLSGDNGTEVYTFDTVSAPVKKSNGQYFDIFLNGTGGSCGFCPTANEYYNVYVEIYRGDAKVIYGTYTNQWVYPAIAEAGAYYTPTQPDAEEPDVPVEPDEPTGPIALTGTATYDNRGFRKNSAGDIVFSPCPSDSNDYTIANDIRANAATYTAAMTVYYQVGGADSTELVLVTSISNVGIKNSSGGAWYIDIPVLTGSADYGFCPVDGAYYTVELNIYNGEELIYCDGLYKNVPTTSVAASKYYYASEVSYTGAQTGDSAIRFVGDVSNAATAIYDKVDLQVTFTGDAEKTFSLPTSKVFTTLKGTKNGETFNAVTVKGSGVEAEETVDAAYLFGYAVTGIPAGTYTVTVTAYAYVGETAIKGKSYTYNTVTVAADGTVTLA